jgi:hypothetical protein
MSQESLKERVERVLHASHKLTAVGQLLDAPGSGVVVFNPALPTQQYIEFLMNEISTIEALLVGIAAEVDQIRPA